MEKAQLEDDDLTFHKHAEVPDKNQPQDDTRKARRQQAIRQSKP